MKHLMLLVILSSSAIAAPAPLSRPKTPPSTLGVYTLVRGLGQYEAHFFTDGSYKARVVGDKRWCWTGTWKMRLRTYQLEVSETGDGGGSWSVWRAPLYEISWNTVTPKTLD